MLVLCLHVLGYVYQDKSQQQQESNYVDIRTIRKLRFYKDEVAESRKMFNRVRNPHLQPQNYRFYPDVIECQNINDDRQMPKWECYVPNNKGIEIVDYSIICEGKHGDYDLNVLKDSCFIKYDVIIQDVGRGRYQHDYQNDNYQRFSRRHQRYSSYYKNGYFTGNTNYQHPIDLRDITLLTFNRKEKTTSKKGMYYNQLTPLRGNLYEPDSITCRNLQLDQYGEIQWDCRANIPYPYNLREATVSCERWSNNNNYEIVPGSCMLQYKIDEVYQPNIGLLGIFLIVIGFILIMYFCNINIKPSLNRYQNHNHFYFHPQQRHKKKDDEDSEDKEDRQHQIAKTKLR